MLRHRLCDATWASLHARLIAIPGIWRKDPEPLRRFVEAVVHVLRAGIAWADLPATFGEVLRRLVTDSNHLTLLEYRDRLAEETGVRVHPWTVGRALGRLRLTRKKAGLARGRAGRGCDPGGAPSLA